MSFRIQEIEEAVWHCVREGGHAAPTKAIVGSMHGDEQIGGQVVRALVDPAHPLWERVPSGEVYLIVGNPEAAVSARRHTDLGSDLNRLFGEISELGDHYEGRRAQALQRHLKETSLLLDLHQTHCATPALAVVPETSAHLALTAALGLGVAVVGTHEIYGDTMVSDWLTRRGGIGITVETGRADTAEALSAAWAVTERFLLFGGDSLPLLEPVQVYEVDEILEAPGSGLRYDRALGNTDTITRGEILGAYDSGVFCAPRDAKVFLPREGVQPGEACLILAREKGLHVPDPTALHPLTRNRADR